MLRFKSFEVRNVVVKLYLLHKGEEFEKAIIKCSATGDSIKVGKYFGFDVTVEKNRNTFNLGTPCIAALNGPRRVRQKLYRLIQF